jgi:hypothetical protein
MIVLPLQKVLYHYTSYEKSLEILSSKSIYPSVPGTYLSVNSEGVFDVASPTGPKGAGWISGRSKIPNIFLTDTLPSLLEMEDFGSNHDKYCAFTISVEDIINQNLRVYQNPSKEYSNIFNIPCEKGQELVISPDKILILNK